jgi:alkylation response protein AidB-like acyl-CoA dehydrogenase
VLAAEPIERNEYVTPEALSGRRARPRNPGDFEDPKLFCFDDQFAGLAALGRIRKRTMNLVRADVEFMRDFCRRRLRPLTLATDLMIQRDHTLLANEMLALAARHHLLTRMVPRFMGGESNGVLWSLNPCAEESAAVEPAFQSGLLGGHGLGMAALIFSGNFGLIDWVVEQTIKGEAEGQPFLIDTAITEPWAGTDVEEIELLAQARLMTRAKQVRGGVVLSGRKCFITGAQLAACHLVIAPFDLADPVGTLAMFLVPAGTPGLTVGKPENKMGHKAGPAGDLVFEDCYVPQENVVFSAQDLPRERRQAILELVLGLTRITVGATGTGVARGAFEVALSFAQNHGWRGRTLISHQWVQAALTDMLIRVYQARGVYLEATQVLLNGFLPGETPRFLDTRLAARIYAHPWTRKLRHGNWFRRLMLARQGRRPLSDMQRLNFYSSLAKVAGTDAGMANCHQALELMGQAGLRQEAGAEKLFRDAKLCQIFEGTNQLNRLNMFKNFIARDIPGLEVF